MSRIDTIGKTATAHCEDYNSIDVIYHNTKVVHVDKVSNVITLNTGGWKTKTTKDRMNQTSNYYNLGYSVTQKNYDWFVEYEGEVIPFTDEILTLSPKKAI